MDGDVRSIGAARDAEAGASARRPRARLRLPSALLGPERHPTERPSLKKARFATKDLAPKSGPAVWGLAHAARRAGFDREVVREKSMGNRMRYSIGVLREAMRRYVDDDHAVYAGHMAFTMLLSLGPFIVCAIILAQQFDPNAAQHLIEMIAQLRASALIPAPMANLLIALVENVAPDPNVTTAARQGDLWVLIVSSLVGLYAGSSAFEAARNGFNEAYDTRDKRNFVFRRFQSHLLALTIAALFVIASVAFVTVTIGLSSVAETQRILADLGIEGDGWRIVFLVGMVAGVALLFWFLLLGIHLTLPRAYVKRWNLYIWAQDEIDDIRAVRVPVKPGVRFSAFVWLLFAFTYSVAIGTFIRFDTNHGALAGVVATLLFFYISASMIFFGAQINIAIATLDRQGKPCWPHPEVPRPVGFDESTQEAYRVLMHTKPQGTLRRVWYYLCGGTATTRPEDKITRAEARADNVNDQRDLGLGAAGAAGAAASLAFGGR